MYRARVGQPGSGNAHSATGAKLPTLVFTGSAIGAAVSFGGLIWTYLKPASFAANLGGTSSDPSTFAWVPHWPVIAFLAVLALAGRYLIAATMDHRRRPHVNAFASLFDIGVLDIPYIIAFFAIGLIYLVPLIFRMVSQGAPPDIQLGCSMSRFFFWTLGVSHFGHAAHAGWWLWLRGTRP